MPRPPTPPLFPYTTLFRSPGGGFSVVVPAGPWTLGPETSFGTFALLDAAFGDREEHTSELQSRRDLVCRLLLEKKNPVGVGADQARQAVRRSAARVTEPVD